MAEDKGSAGAFVALHDSWNARRKHCIPMC